MHDYIHEYQDIPSKANLINGRYVYMEYIEYL